MELDVVGLDEGVNGFHVADVDADVDDGDVDQGVVVHRGGVDVLVDDVADKLLPD